MQNDPTDHALAAIASIMDQSREKPETRSERLPEAESDVAPAPDAEPAPEPEAMSEPAPAPAPALVDLPNYTRLGPGPIDALRFRWSARRDDDEHYYVDETIGPSSRPLSTGPMPADEVISFIEQRAREVEQRFRALKDEMTIAPREPEQPHYENGES